VNSLKAPAERRNWTELNWDDLAFDELTNGQAVMHNSGHRLTASMTDVTIRSRTRQPMTKTRRACPLVCSSKTKSRQFSSVQLRRSVRGLSLSTPRSVPVGSVAVCDNLSINIQYSVNHLHHQLRYLHSTHDITIILYTVFRKKHPLMCSFISLWKMFRFLQNFQEMFSGKQVFQKWKS